jgi:hypothetical protein
MTDLASCLEEYLQLRRGLGHQMGHAERPLRQFVAHLSERGLDTVTVVDAIEWAGEETLSHPRPPTRATLRLSVVEVSPAGCMHSTRGMRSRLPRCSLDCPAVVPLTSTPRSK